MSKGNNSETCTILNSKNITLSLYSGYKMSTQNIPVQNISVNKFIRIKLHFTLLLLFVKTSI